MSNQWNNSQFQQGLPSTGNQVRMFDPTQFQTTTAYGTAPANKPKLHNRPQSAVSPAAQSSTSLQATQSSWNSWNSWNWNSEATNTPAVDQQQQQQNEQAQQQVPQQHISQQQIPQQHTPQQHTLQQHISQQHTPQQHTPQQQIPQQQIPQQHTPQQHTPQQQIQQQQISQQQIPQQQTPQQQTPQQQTPQQQIPQGGTGDQQFYSDSHYANTFNQGWDTANQYSQQQQTYAQSDTGVLYQNQELQQQQTHWDHQQYGGSTYGQGQYDGGMLGQIPYNASDPNAQHQQQNQQSQQGHQQSFTNQFYYQQQQADQGQAYNQSQEHYLSQTAAVYNNPYNAGTWSAANESGQWVSGNQEQPQMSYNPEGARQDASNEQQQLNVIQNATSQNNTQASTHSQSSHGSAVARPGLEVYSADDDGTVSGFFGRDDDGDIQLDSRRHGQASQGSEIAPGFNQYLAVGQPFHRTDSEISNASLSTVNLSNSEDEDGRKRLQKVEEVALVQREWRENNIVNPLAANMSRAGPYHSQDVSNEFLQKQTKEDHVGFSSNAYNPPSLPLETNIRPSYLDGEHPDSAESGGSGGSSGLADWEIVPPQTSSLTLSHNCPLDNSISFVTDNPDGGVRVPSSYGNLEHQDKSPQGSLSQASCSATSDQNAHSGFQNRGLPDHSSTHETQTAFLHESVQSHHDTSSPSAAAFRDHQQKESSLPPLQVSTVSNLPLPSLPQTDGAANPFRRDGGKSPRHAITSQSTHSVHPSSSAPLTLQGDAWSAENKTYPTTYPSSDAEKSRTTIPPSKPKLPLSLSAEDGNRISRRDSDHGINSADTSQTKSNILNSEQVALPGQQQQQHHSAFQPVSRPQGTTMSPATSLWDNSQAPASNILLAPVVPLIIPALNPYSVSAADTTSSAVGTSTAGNTSEIEKIGDKLVSKGPHSSVDSSVQRRVNERQEARDRQQAWKEEKNRSFDSLDEIGAVDEGQRHRSYHSEKSQVRKPDYASNYNRRESDRHDSDRPLSRNNRPSSRHDSNGHYRDDQLPGRTEGYSKEDPYRRQRDYNRDYGDSSYDERYDRPRSQQDESYGSRPSSRSTQEVTRPRSRADYDRDRDYYYRVRHRGYDYDGYSRNADYLTEERDRYYKYSREKEARYARAYYEEYYGPKYAEYYKNLELQQYQQQYQDRRVSSQEFDRSSSRSQSRGSTPAVGPSPGIPSSPGPDHFGSRDSRPTSRTDYSRDYYNRGHSYEGYNAYYDGYGYDPYAYGYDYPGYDEYSQAYDQGRMTPPKYSYPHARACFGPGGQLVKVLPNRPKDGQPAIVELQDMQTILENSPEAEELRIFPGPLTRKSTHKKDVLLFCRQKVRACADDINMMDRESAQLIWRFLELLIKQNGSVVGTDLADLLLEGHEPSTHEYSLHGMKISQSSETLDTVPEGNSEDSSSAGASPAVRVTSDRTVISSADRERETWVDRFRHLLLYGRKKDALECAMKSNLWGHALFLASKMDTRTYANVMTRFANSAMRMNDPLQTLYQLMSGRQPAAVTCIVDERWGDWRPHLAMILSNQATKHDIDRKSITTLGDTLAAKGYLYASHFCYLMAQVNFGSYFKKTSKIVLIGTSHNLPMEEFASNEAIQCTEVYEYAQTLSNPAFCLPHLQSYKYLYACRLADYGMIQEALHYCEVIAYNIQQNPTWFQAPFVRLVSQLSRKLQYSDPQYQIPEEEKDHSWVQQLESICAAYDNGSIQPLSGTAMPAGFPGTTADSENNDNNQVGYGYSGDPATTNMAASAPNVDVYGHQSQSLPDNSGGQDVNAITGQMQSLDITDQHYLQQQGYSQQQLQGFSQQQQGYIQQQQGYSQQHYDYSQWQQQYGSHLDSSSSSTQLASQLHSHSYEGEHHLLPRTSISTTEASEDDDDDVDDDDVLDASASGFDYFGNVGSQKVVAPPHRYRSMSGSSAGSTRRRRTTSGSSTGSVKAAPHKSGAQQKPAEGKGGDKAQKDGQQDNRGSGWFGGLFNKFKHKGKNEMILPDDKNPPIVWDPAKKKWTNADGTEEVEAPKAPPPKDTDLLGKPPATAPTSNEPPPPSSMVDGNRFSLKAKGARNQYVDVNNPMPVSVPQNLFNVMPTDTSNVYNAAPQSFLPGAGQTTGTEARNVSSSTGTSLVTGRESGSSIEVSNTTTAAGVTQHAPHLPVLFNPASLRGSSAGAGQLPSAAGPGLKYGQRRAYPK